MAMKRKRFWKTVIRLVILAVALALAFNTETLGLRILIAAVALAVIGLFSVRFHPEAEQEIRHRKKARHRFPNYQEPRMPAGIDDHAGNVVERICRSRYLRRMGA
jgi:hypothetical protein